jgi:pimeloyl-ACP methyl ester carboxylesterase
MPSEATTTPHEEHLAPAKDGTLLYWEEWGAGHPPVILTDGVGCAGYIWERLAPDLARRHRTIHWNYRGHGKSAVPHDPLRVTLDDAVEDLLAVMDDAEVPRAVLAGHSMGVQVVLEAHRRAPHRIDALVLACGSYGRPLDTFHDSPLLSRVFPSLKRAVLAHPDLTRSIFRTFVPTRFSFEVGRWLEVNRQLLPADALRRYLADLAAIDPEVFVRTLASAADHDAGDHLAGVDVPTLVIAGQKDTFTPMWLSERIHATIPGAEMLVLPAGTHTGVLEHPELVALRLEKFLAERVLPRMRAAEVKPPPTRRAGRSRTRPRKLG